MSSKVSRKKRKREGFGFIPEYKADTIYARIRSKIPIFQKVSFPLTIVFYLFAIIWMDSKATGPNDIWTVVCMFFGITIMSFIVNNFLCIADAYAASVQVGKDTICIFICVFLVGVVQSVVKRTILHEDKITIMIMLVFTIAVVYHVALIVSEAYQLVSSEFIKYASTKAIMRFSFAMISYVLAKFILFFADGFLEYKGAFTIIASTQVQHVILFVVLMIIASEKRVRMKKVGV